MLLATAEDVLILTHKSPDGDTLGSAYGLYYALTAIGKRARVACSDPLPKKFDYFYPKAPFEDFEPRYIVAVDVADPQLLGSALQQYAGRIDLCIDHHISNTGYAGQLLLDHHAAATAEVVCEIVNAMGVTLTSQIATALYTGIATDTGCFRYSNTSAKTHLIASRLIEAGIDLPRINQLLFETKTRARIALERLGMATLEYSFGQRCATIVLSQEILTRSGAEDEDIDGISSLPRQIEGVQVGVTMRERSEGGYKVSLRAAEGVDASAICKLLGGGGHRAAAGCVVHGTEQEAKAQLAGAIATQLEAL